MKEALKNKDYRHGYIDEFLNIYIATQIKALREQRGRGWSQTRLAKEARMKQSRISLLENVNYSSWSINVLRKLAEAFDLALCVSFEEFGKRVKDVEMFSREYLERNSFDEDPYFFKEDKKGNAIADITQYKEFMTPGTSGKTIDLNNDDKLEASFSPLGTIFEPISEAA